MKRRTFLTALLAAPMLPQLSLAQSPPVRFTPPDPNAFALELFRHAAPGQTNTFCSPASISAALTMTWAGARGRTAAEMAKVLGLTGAPAEVAGRWRDWRSDLLATTADAGYQLRLANRLFGATDMRYVPEFLTLTREAFGAQLQPMDFAAAPGSARKRINRWVGKQTNERIPQLLAPGIIKASTRLVLANAIWFKGAWSAAFAKDQTRKGRFTLADGQGVDAMLMSRQLRTGAAHVGDVKVCALPYGKNKRLRMLIAVPTRPDGLATLRRGLSAATVTGWTRALRQRRVHITLPRWKAESSFELKTALTAMGMPSAFTNAADFGGITPARDIKISKVVHKSFVEVAEEGTEAAAATAVIITRTGTAGGPFTVRADHPFLYFITDSTNGSILFMGQLDRPTT